MPPRSSTFLSRPSGLPLTARCGGDVGGFSDALVHRHIRKGLVQNAIMDRPGSQTDAVRGLRRTERSGAIELLMIFAARLEAGVDFLHAAFAHLIGKPVALEDDRVVIIERLDEIHVMPQPCNESFECRCGWLQQP